MNRKVLRFATLVTFTAIAVAVPFGASAGVRKEGTWPASEDRVSLDFDGSPGDGLQHLAKKAGWSLVVAKDAVPSLGDVHVAVRDQPADAVLEALFVEGDVVARRSGDLITVTRAPAPAPPPAPDPALALAPAPPPAPPPAPAAARSAEGEDREIFGGSLVLRKDETAHNVTVTGGSARIEGDATGDLVVMGGSATVVRGAHVGGSATVLGGTLHVEDGARVDGDVGVVGGVLKRDPGAVIRGNVIKGSVKGLAAETDKDDGDRAPRADAAKPNAVVRALHDFGRRVTRYALLFVLGCVFLSLLARPMERVRVEAAARPMRAFAVGVVSAIAIPFALLILCITIVGIPVAILLSLLLALSLYGSIAAVLTTLGALVAGHRTTSPFVHLAVGCAMALVVTSLPWIGGLATALLALVALGAVVGTRGGGLVGGTLRRTSPLV